ncbi:lysine-epsilon-oxidase maturase LodB [Thalassomonas actiniarum]|uniref:Tryptophan 7-halogenase n=1 Tax=Thalassomonas actiniarum TaxID=485447 RepID=A0AAE9YP62_9GAMM|nr:lysine-epsilon-oxidase maturase LodB [Thalassomonas actiniarum]WDD97052.1 tryptophan 7-halogenase [Thalassomonas actiniarum]
MTDPLEQTEINTDVIIVGAGPAGAAAALTLLTYSDLKVTLVEQADLNDVRVAEHVGSDIFDLLGYLKITKSAFPEDTFLPCYNQTSYWGGDEPVSVQELFNIDNKAFRLDREKFDFVLLGYVAARGGLVYSRTRCTGFAQGADHSWQLNLKNRSQGRFKLNGRYLIDACGRKADVCRQVGVLSARHDKLMGVGAFFHFDKSRKTKQEQVMESHELGWWYCARLPDQRQVVAFFSDADIIGQHRLNQPENWQQLLAQSRHIKFGGKGGAVLAGAPWVRNASSHITHSVLKKNFIAVGDAAASFDPISAIGLGFAMTSACHGAKAVQTQLTSTDKHTKKAQLDAYQQEVVDHFEHYLRLRKKCYRHEHRWSGATFWSRRR